MSAESPGPRGRFAHGRLRFRGWRRSRPFWAGLLTLMGGLPIAYFPYANLKLGHLTLTMATTAGAGSLIIGVLLVTLGLTMWFQPVVRVFAGVAAILLALISLPVSNLGGFFLGFVCALVGGALSIAWAPGRPGEAVDVEADAGPLDAAPQETPGPLPADLPGGAGAPADAPAPRDPDAPGGPRATALEASGGTTSAV
ncbi:DUF6114 domain-containing protein [Streptomyces sp. TRM70308]|uniref:DUF6114 domain-containing protein n=1 Tax=Streptomyces TaxID=1883 RepID=UPI0022497827|nr:DUF6114 domain-containing protein [Streptomyces sp. JHD 1]MCX2967357.1 DUF6114 domain-containing protein [Streptomyces sp. JHD 1]